MRHDVRFGAASGNTFAGAVGTGIAVSAFMTDMFIFVPSPSRMERGRWRGLAVRQTSTRLIDRLLR